MSNMKNGRWLVKSYPADEVSVDNFELVYAEVRARRGRGSYTDDFAGHVTTTSDGDWNRRHHGKSCEDWVHDEGDGAGYCVEIPASQLFRR